MGQPSPLQVVDHSILHLKTKVYGYWEAAQDDCNTKNSQIMVTFLCKLAHSEDASLISYLVQSRIFSDVLLFELKLENEQTIQMIYQIILRLLNAKNAAEFESFLFKNGKLILNYVVDGINNSQQNKFSQKDFCILFLKQFYENCIICKADAENVK